MKSEKPISSAENVAAPKEVLPPTPEAMGDMFEYGDILEKTRQDIESVKSDTSRMLETYDQKFQTVDPNSEYSLKYIYSKQELEENITLQEKKYLADVDELFAVNPGEGGMVKLANERVERVKRQWDWEPLDSSTEEAQAEAIPLEEVPVKPEVLAEITVQPKKERSRKIEINAQHEKTITEEVKVESKIKPEKSEPESKSETKQETSSPKEEPKVTFENPEGVDSTYYESEQARNPHVARAQTEGWLLTEYGVSPESTFAAIRRHTPKAVHSFIDKWEARSETKTVNKLYQGLAEIDGKRQSAQVNVKQLEDSLGKENAKIKSIEADQHLPLSEKRRLTEKVTLESERIGKRLESAKAELKIFDTRYDLNRAEMKVYEERRNNAVERVSAKLNEKIEPHRQRLEALNEKKDKIQGEVDRFNARNNELQSQVADFERKINRLPAKEKSKKRVLKGIVKKIGKQMEKNRKLSEKQLKKVYKLDAKLVPLNKTFDAWQTEKKGFEKLSGNKSEKYSERQKSVPEEKVDNVNNNESIQSEAPAHNPESGNLAKKDGSDIEKIEDIPFAKRAPERLDEYLSSVESTEEHEPQTFEEYVSAWNKDTENYRAAKHFKIQFGFEEGVAKAEIERKFRKMAHNHNADMNDLLPRQMRDYLVVYSEYRKQQEDMNKAIQEEKEYDPSFSPTENWKIDWNRKWDKEWHSSRKAFGFRRSAKAHERKQFHTKVEHLFNAFYKQTYGKEVM